MNEKRKVERIKTERELVMESKQNQQLQAKLSRTAKNYSSCLNL